MIVDFNIFFKTSKIFPILIKLKNLNNPPIFTFIEKRIR